MRGSLGIVVLISLALAGCAHKPLSVADGAKPTPQEIADDKVIQQLPGPKLDSSANEIGQIPVEVNSEVEKWIGYFQGRGRGYFERYLERSTRYTALMKKVLKDNGVPEDLIYVAMIESGFSGKIKSRARAVGFWQFIGGTGKHYGLRVNQMMDERYDPVRSTEAAAAYFKGLYNLFNSWFLAIASYNVGENRIKSLVMKNYTRDFWELARRKQLPAETIQYIPKFLAAGLIAREPEKYGFMGLNYEAPMVYDTVTAKETVDMKLLAKSLHIDFHEIKELNPAYKTQYVPVIGDLATVRVPQGMGEAARISVLDALVKNKRFMAAAAVTTAKTSFVRYRVKKGETLEKIAKQFDVSVDEILKANRMRKSRIRAGKTIKIPSSAYNLPKESTFSGRQRKVGSFTYTVRRGETLSRIAQQYRVSVSNLARENNFGTKYKVMVGQKIIIPSVIKRNSKKKKLAQM